MGTVTDLVEGRGGPRDRKREGERRPSVLRKPRRGGLGQATTSGLQQLLWPLGMSFIPEGGGWARRDLQSLAIR